jgi:inhibitor of KinA sporulation pathway (predicted exonuclease)
LRGAVKAIRRASTLSFRSRVRNDTYNLVTFSPSCQVVAAAVDITNSKSPLKTKLMITKIENLENRNVVSAFAEIHHEPRDVQINALAASDSFVAVGSDAGFELHSVRDATRSFSQSFEQMVKAVALFHNPNTKEDFVCIGTGDMRVYHSRILRKDNPNATEEPYKLAIDEGRQWIEMSLDNRDRVAIVTYSEDGDRICVGSTNGKIYIFNIDGTRASHPYRLPISSVCPSMLYS